MKGMIFTDIKDRMEDIIKYLRENFYNCNYKSEPEREAYTTVIAHYERFDFDADKFTDTKRFERFMNIFEKKAGEIVTNLNMVMISSENDNIVKKANDSNFMKSIYVTTRAYLCDKYSGKERKPETGWLSMCEIYAKSTIRLFSTLGEVKRMLEEGDAFDAKLMLKCINSSFTVDRFEPIYNMALYHACYDYISMQAAEKQLTQEDWFIKLKELDYHQTFQIMVKVFEYIVALAEDTAALRLIHNYHLKGDTVSKLLFQIGKIKEEKEELDKVITNKQELITAKDKEIADLRKQNADLQKQLNRNTSDNQERAMLRKKLKEEKAENAELQQKLASMQEYIELLSVKEEPETVPEAAEDDATLFADKHIVFIRDKKNKDYILMKRLAERFPNANFTNAIASDIDIKATDLIVQLIQYQGHSAYWKAAGVAKRNNIPVIAVTNANFDVITKQICKELSGKEG